MFHDTTFQFLTDPRTLGSIIVTASSVLTFFIAFHKGAKTEQMNIALEISTRLEDAENKIFHLEDELVKSTNKGYTSDSNESVLRTNIEDAEHIHMNHWEFYALLVNSGQITNKKIKKHFEESFIEDTDDFFKKYPKYLEKGKLNEIKQLRKKMRKEIKESNTKA